jgi:hypothetical protein
MALAVIAARRGKPPRRRRVPFEEDEDDEWVVPSAHDCTREGYLEKMVMHTNSVVWHPRLAVLSAERNKLYFCDPSDRSSVYDYILLDEINGVESVGVNDQVKLSTSPGSSFGWSSAHDSNVALFNIRTELEGHNKGRVYTQRCRDKDDARAWVDLLQKCARDAEAKRKKLEIGDNRWALMRERAKNFEQSRGFSVFIVTMILVAFVVDIAEAEWLNDPASTSGFETFNVFVTAVFTLELFLSLFIRSQDCFRSFWYMAMLHCLPGHNLIDVSYTTKRTHVLSHHLPRSWGPAAVDLFLPS